MLKNENYNLLEEIVQISQSLYRLDTYIQDAHEAQPPCEDCVRLWERMRARLEDDLRLLTRHFKEHMDQGRVRVGEKLVLPGEEE
ncbi:MAG: hypothetical protein Kow00129_09280 [Thermoleophilia bacterium]